MVMYILTQALKNVNTFYTVYVIFANRLWLAILPLLRNVYCSDVLVCLSPAYSKSSYKYADAL